MARCKASGPAADSACEARRNDLLGRRIGAKAITSKSELQAHCGPATLRHRCRNPRCRLRLPKPVENEHHAFCCRSCFESFYRARVRVCERDITADPMTGTR